MYVERRDFMGKMMVESMRAREMPCQSDNKAQGCGNVGSMLKIIGNSSGLKAACLEADDGVIQRAKFVIENEAAGGGLYLRLIEGEWGYGTDFSNFLSLYHTPGTVWDTETLKVTLDGRIIGQYIYPDVDFIYDHMDYTVDEEEESDVDAESDDDDEPYIPLSDRPRSDRYILSYDALRRRRYRYLQDKHHLAPVSHAFPDMAHWAEGYNPHHIIPNEAVRDTIQPDYTDPYNDAWNCIMLPNISSSTFSYHGKSGQKERLLPLHSGHKKYNARVTALLKRTLPSIEHHSDEQKLAAAKEVAGTIRGLIHQAAGTAGQIRLDDMMF